jgi:hypothetical protein
MRRSALGALSSTCYRMIGALSPGVASARHLHRAGLGERRAPFSLFSDPGDPHRSPLRRHPSFCPPDWRRGAHGAAALLPGDAAPVAALAAWVEACGGAAANVTISRDAHGGYGLRATSALHPGDQMVFLPKRCVLCYGGETADPALLALIDRVPSELWGAKLALQLLAQRALGPTSVYAPYVASLPAAISGLPMFFQGPALAALFYPPVTQQVKKRCRWLLSFAKEELAPLAGDAGGPFGGAAIDANALGVCFFAS